MKQVEPVDYRRVVMACYRISANGCHGSRDPQYTVISPIKPDNFRYQIGPGIHATANWRQSAPPDQGSNPGATDARIRQLGGGRDTS